MKNLQHIFITFFLLGSIYSYGQTFISNATLDSIIITHQYHCDTVDKKHQDFINLGEEPMRLAYIEYKKHAHRMIIKGQVVDKETIDVIPFCPIYIANSVCSLHLIGTTDKNGTFNLTFPYMNWQSIYITYVGYYDIEIPLDKLNSH